MIALALALITTLTLAACASSGGNNTSGGGSSPSGSGSNPSGNRNAAPPVSETPGQSQPGKSNPLPANDASAPGVTGIYSNTPGNINAGGLAAMQGDWIYYSEISDGGKLYAVNTASGVRKKINDDKSDFINVVGEWVYYSNGSDDSKIYRIKTDGSGREKLNDEGSGALTVVGDWIYYSTMVPGAGFGLHKIKTDGSERQALGKNTPTGSINIVGEWIYYVNGGIGRIKTDGSGEQMITDVAAERIIIKDDWVYYALHKMRIDGADDQRLGDDSSMCVIVDGDWIYYTTFLASDGVYRIRTDGGERQMLINSGGASYFNIVGDWIVYHDFKQTYIIKTDGSENQPIEGFLAKPVATDAPAATDSPDAPNAPSATLRPGQGVTVDSILGKWKLLVDVGNTQTTYYEFKAGGVLIISVELQPNAIVVGPTQFDAKYNLNGSVLTITTTIDGIEESDTGDIAIVDDTLYYVAEGVAVPVMIRASSDSGGSAAATPRPSSAESVNGKVWAVQDDWIYYISFSTVEGDGRGFGRIHKIRADGSGRQQITNDRSGNLVVVGDWIYYSIVPFSGNSGGDRGLFKVKTDGSGRQMLSEGGANHISVAGDWVYFCGNYSDNGKIYRIKTDGSEKQELKGNGTFARVSGDWVYYVQVHSPGMSICRMKTDGSEDQSLHTWRITGSFNMAIVDGWVFHHGDGLQKMRIDGSEKQTLAEVTASNITVANDWVYFSNGRDSMNLYRVRTDGSEIQKLTDDRVAEIYVYGDRIYCSMSGRTIFSMNLDGSNIRQLMAR